jgi:antibiotic biosynthesis monooxygenase (ABM) superfamily enzyme
MAEIQPMGLLAVWLHVPPEREDEFNAWYDTEHIQQITGIPGFINGRRYLALEGVPKYLALYELHDEAITAGGEFQHILANPTPWSARMRDFYQGYRIRNTYRLLFTSGEAPAKDTPYVYIVKTDIPADRELDFNEWYTKEHIPALASVPGCCRARRFLAVDGQPKYMAVYELENPEVIQSTAWAKARDTAWTETIRPHMHNLDRRVYQLILPAK